MAAVKTSSNGMWQGDNPLHFAFPLLIIQALLILLLSRFLAFLLRPLRQPKVIAEIVAGILLGPSALGRNKAYLRTLFPPWSAPVLESAASLGLLFFLFLVGLELDLRSVRRSGRRAFAIAAAGISLPFACGVGVAFVVRAGAVPGADQAGYAPFLVFMGVALSITAFPVLARILAELKLLTTPIGETALAAAAFNDVAAWVLLALAVAISADGGSPVTSLWVLLSGAAFVGAWMAAVRPLMSWVARRAEYSNDAVWVGFTMAGVLASGLATDMIGIHAIFGAFVFGLTVPKDEGGFAGRVTERVEDLVSELLLPLYFASSGLKTDVATIFRGGGRAFGVVALVIGTACAGKILGTFAVAMACGMAAKEAVVLGVLMNTKGLVELIVLNIGRERKVLNEEMFAILVIMALVTTFITTPTVMAIYKPARRRLHHRKLHGPTASSAPASPSAGAATANAKELRVLACIHGGHEVPALINLIETIRGHTQPRRLVKLYILRLVELTERTSSILMARAARRNGVPAFLSSRRASSNGGGGREMDVAFGTYAQLGHVSVRPMTAVSALHTMHDDVAAVAEDKRVSLVVLPFHKRAGGGGGEEESLGPEWRAVNRRILREAPCSVAVLVDRGFGGGEQVSSDQVAHGVCVVFFGGPDDREALELAGRMAEHPGVQLNVVRFLDGSKKPAEVVALRPTSDDQIYTFSAAATANGHMEKEMDEVAVAEFRQRMGAAVRFEERVVAGDVVEEVVGIGKSREYGLVVVGKGRLPSSMVAELAVRRPAEHPELGPVGDALASAGHGVAASVLVVQQHDVNAADEVPVSVVHIDAHAGHGEP